MRRFTYDFEGITAQINEMKNSKDELKYDVSTHREVYEENNAGQY